MDNIVNKVRKFPMNIQTELNQVADTVKCDDSDAIDIPMKRRVNFLCAQLKLCCVISDNGRRYTAELMRTAIELMLRHPWQMEGQNHDIKFRLDLGV